MTYLTRIVSFRCLPCSRLARFASTSGVRQLLVASTFAVVALACGGEDTLVEYANDAAVDMHDSAISYGGWCPDASCPAIQCPAGTSSQILPNVCVDIDECASLNGGCGNATFFECVNQTAWAPLCRDRDECATLNGWCGDPAFVTCVNRIGEPPDCVLRVDAGEVDAGELDAGETDASMFDAGEMDASMFDAGGADAGTTDAGDMDAGIPDAGEMDAATPDASACPYGFELSAANGCVDIAECANHNGGCGNATYIRCVENVGAAPGCQIIENCGRFFGGAETVFDTWTGQEWDRNVPWTKSADWYGAQAVCRPGFRVPYARDLGRLGPLNTCAFLDGGQISWTASVDPANPTIGAYPGSPGEYIMSGVLMTTVMPVRCMNGTSPGLFWMPGLMTYWPQ